MTQVVSSSLCQYWLLAKQLRAHHPLYLLYWTVYIGKCGQAWNEIAIVKADRCWRKDGRGNSTRARSKTVMPNVKTASE